MTVAHGLLNLYLFGLPVEFLIFSFTVFVAPPRKPFAPWPVLCVAALTVGWPLIILMAIGLSIARAVSTLGLGPKSKR